MNNDKARDAARENADDELNHAIDLLMKASNDEEIHGILQDVIEAERAAWQASAEHRGQWVERDAAGQIEKAIQAERREIAGRLNGVRHDHSHGDCGICPFINELNGENQSTTATN